MPLCSSCGAENPEGAKFCAKCGKLMVHPAASTVPTQPMAQAAQPPVSKPVAGREPPEARQEAASQEGEIKPNPNAPGQTHFFISAAKVSTAAKVKRVVFFIIGAIVVGTAVFFLVQKLLHQHDTPELQKPSKTTPMEKVDTTDTIGAEGVPSEGKPVDKTKEK